MLSLTKQVSLLQEIEENSFSFRDSVLLHPRMKYYLRNSQTRLGTKLISKLLLGPDCREKILDVLGSDDVRSTLNILAWAPMKALIYFLQNTK